LVGFWGRQGTGGVSPGAYDPRHLFKRTRTANRAAISSIGKIELYPFDEHNKNWQLPLKMKAF